MPEVAVGCLIRQVGQTTRGERIPSREFAFDAMQVMQVRKMIGLSQVKFAAVLHVPVTTLQGWEQGRREPQGPARALLRAIRKSPKEVLRALA